jgi:hypothetical protein
MLALEAIALAEVGTMFIWMVAVGVFGPAVMFAWAAKFLPADGANDVPAVIPHS